MNSTVVSKLKQELEEKNRELAIQTSLEKVRTVAMAMKKPEDMLAVCRVITKELEGLGIKEIRNIQTAIVNEKKAVYQNYEYFRLEKKEVITSVAYKQHKDTHAFIRKMLKDPEGFFTKSFKRADIRNWMKFQVKSGQYVDPYLKKTNSLHYYFYSIGSGALGISTYAPLSKEAIELFKRFRNVFKLAYQRFTDIQKAEAHTREAEIQLALERVRSRALAMHKSDELTDTSSVLFHELNRLGIHPRRSGFGIYQLDKGSIRVWLTTNSEDVMETAVLGSIPLNAHPVIKANYDAWKKKKSHISHEITGRAVPAYYRRIGTFMSIAPRKKYPPKLIFNVYFFSEGSLNVMADEPLTEEQNQIVLRFAKVFEQAYTRFLDLQKAEASAKEAQIEASLERIRARAMAMHKTDELLDAAQLVHKELANLGINSMNVSYAFVDKNEKYGSYYSINPVDGKILPIPFIFPHTETKVMRGILNSWKQQQPFNIIELNEKQTIQHQTYIGEQIKQQLAKTKIPFSVKEFLAVSPKNAVLSTFNFSKGYLFNIGGEHLSKTQLDILLRVTKVFEQTYTRFLDLQKAELQARQAQIELAVERVRAKALAMHKSDELHGVVTALKKELIGIDIPNVIAATMYLEQDDGSIRMVDLTTGGAEDPGDHLKLDKVFRLESTDPKLWVRRMFKNTNKYFVEETDDNDFNRVISWLDSVDPVEARKAKKILREKNINKVWLPTVKLEKGRMNIDLLQPPTPEIEQIMLKLGAGFDLAYRRFLDLQKAEAQTRESQIELGLERVRARAMAMHKSEEVMDVAGTLFEELQKLNFSFGASSIIIMDKESGDAEYWIAGFSKNKFPESYPVKYFRHPYHDTLLTAWKKGEKYLVYNLKGKEKKTYDEVLFSKTGYRNIPENEKQLMRGIPSVTFSIAFMKHGALHWGPSPLDGDQSNVLQRFAQVFEQAYIRFLDLKKAEAQTREARIEAALEKVRSRALAMHRADELGDVITVIVKKLKELDFSVKDGVALITYIEGSKDLIEWMENPGFPTAIKFYLPYFEHPILAHLWKMKEQGFDFAATKFTADESRSFLEYIFQYTDYKHTPQPIKDYSLAANSYSNYIAFQKHTSIFINDYSERGLTEQEIDILKRFSKVFEQAYIRFLDLQIAEENARESQIEASLERVRAKAMSMHSSEELASAITTFYHEIEALTVTPIRCGVAMTDKDTKIAELSTMNTKESGESFVVMGQIKMEGHPILDEVFQHWLQQKEYHATLRGNEIKEYYKILRPQIDFPDYPLDEVQYGYYFMFKEGDVYAWTENPLTEEQLKIYRRFTTVLSLTFKRYKDLKYAESQAREANIEVALERVRAKALAMQQPEELSDVAQVLRKEMGALGIEELETASIYIHENDSDTAECWYALKDPTNESKKMVADQFIVHLNETWVGREMKKFYLSGEKQTSIVMKGDKRKEWIEYCYKHSPVLNGYYGDMIPDRTYHIYKFSHGYIGAAAPGDLSTESWKLLSRAASVFSLAYSRFKDLAQARTDLQRLKEEKQRAESALAELRSTQTQLIQSEKMASLGELTAGIAHEIQNPLNFVNNFSEVSNELITEMLEQLEKGNKENAIDLVEDVKQNLEKINQHGKRADSIVKSMLQHSRSSTGQKEPTDINALVDEYLRLAFHGFRAKDQSFNSKFETHLDESLEKINLVPQEIGRVILNLINNAFYAVMEKRKADIPGYEPMVIVSTRKNNGVIEIRVQDNGNGMPSHVTEKIFQPFFTTKPTGQGTGLGLSLSYDIVTKGHGGELKVNTREGEGSEFVVQLPA